MRGLERLMAGVRRRRRFRRGRAPLLEAGFDVAVRPLVSSVALPIGSLPSSDSAKSSSVHFNSWTLGPAAAAAPRLLPALAAAADGASRRCLPSRAFGPPGRRLTDADRRRTAAARTRSGSSRSPRPRSARRPPRRRESARPRTAARSSGRARLIGLAVTLSPRSVTPAAGAGRSSAVRIAFTPGIASAALVSMLITRACGIGLSSSLANSMPSARKSSAYFALPGDLRDEVGRRVVLSDQLVLGGHGYALRISSAPRISAVRILS